MSNEPPKIIKVREFLGLALTIPPYQRPYKWSTDSALTLFNDLYGAFKDAIPEYRIGTAVLHPETKIWENENTPTTKFNIVDGQQRATTLSILMYCFSKKLPKAEYSNLSKLLDEKAFKVLSVNSIVDNYEILNSKLEEVPGEKVERFLTYILDNCTVVKIETNTEQEAFQFFDSQNSRGKELAPHDLLKSYHLREMSEENETEKVSIINSWENTDQKKLAAFFYSNLYPMVCWYKGKSGLYYSSKKIKTFKGLKQNNNYHFSIYHKAANLYIEHFNEEGMYELTSNKKLDQFQLTQPIIAGKRFFLFSLYYYDLQREVEKRYFHNSDMPTPDHGAGNIYIRNLFLNIVTFFVDKFNFEVLTDYRIKKLYKWCYSLRLVMHSVYPETIKKYALGEHDRINKGKKLFNLISEMQSPEEFDSIILDKVDPNNIKYNDKSVNMMKKIMGVE